MEEQIPRQRFGLKITISLMYLLWTIASNRSQIKLAAACADRSNNVVYIQLFLL